MEKIVQILLGVLCVIFLLASIVCYIFYARTDSKLQSALKDLAQANTALDFQNAQIQKNALELESYKAQKQTQSQKIITKYSQIKVLDTTCEAQLNAINELLKEFGR